MVADGLGGAVVAVDEGGVGLPFVGGLVAEFVGGGVVGLNAFGYFGVDGGADVG